MYNSKLCWTLSYFSFYDYWINFNFCFVSLISIPIGITSYAVGLKICAVTVGIKNYKSIIKIKKKKHDKIVLLAKSKLNSIEVVVSKALIDSAFSYEEFILINNVQEEYNYMKE